MLIEYYATKSEDAAIDRAIEHLVIDNAFNPEDCYYVLETKDDRVLTIMSLMGIELYVTDNDKDWFQHAFGAKDQADVNS